jgi:hypothetical protein
MRRCAALKGQSRDPNAHRVTSTAARDLFNGVGESSTRRPVDSIPRSEPWKSSRGCSRPRCGPLSAPVRRPRGAALRTAPHTAASGVGDHPGELRECVPY